MTDASRAGWSELTVDAITALDAKEFERLCYEIVSYEAYERHDGPELEGPATDYTADQGRDILLEVTRAPVMSKLAFQKAFHTKPLTEDHLGRTVYSCKAGKNWLDDALRDAKERGQRAVEVLREGGFFKLLVSQSAQLDRSYRRDRTEGRPHEHLVRVFRERLGPDAPVDLGQRIEIIDVQKLRDFLLRVRPEDLLNLWGPKLGLVRMLDDIEAWSLAHQFDRFEPPFEYDPRREALRDELQRFFEQPVLNKGDRVARLLGPPGIGKTRLVLECLRPRATLASRLRAARNRSMATRAFGEGFWESHPRALVVVDDCPDEDVRDLEATFAARARDMAARLLLITPTKQTSHRTHLTTWVVEPLASDQARQLLDATLPGRSDEQTKTQIVKLAEGFPWFIILLAQEASRAHRGPTSMDEAVGWVLASSDEASGAALEATRQDRARALLAVALTRTVDWDNLTQVEQEQLVRAVGLSQWPQLRELAAQCHRRGLVRLQLRWHFKYITPAVLEREVVRRLLGPQGPDPGGSRLFREAGAWAQQLFERLPTLGLSPDTLRVFGSSAVQELRSLESLEQLPRQGLVGERLRLGAAWCPRECSRELRRLVTSAADLSVFSAGRQEVVAALEQAVLSSPAVFDDVEDALFQLARAENESYLNNATGVWANLFLVEMAFVLLPVEPRLRRLCVHGEAADVQSRRLALRGLEAMLTTPGFRLVPPGAGEPVSLPAEGVRQARREAWGLLGPRLRDEDATVAREARSLAQRLLTAGGPPGVLVEALTQLLAQVEGFQGQERTALGDVLRSVPYPDDEEAAALLARLADRLKPHTLLERLREQVGLWGESRGGVTPQDEALSEEMLARLPASVAELRWLLSEEAERGWLFAQALGRKDPTLSLLPWLVAEATTRASRQFVVSYFRGLQSVLSPERFRQALEDLRRERSTVPLFALVAAATGPGEQDRRAILEALAGGDLDEDVVVSLVRLLPVESLPVGDVDALLRGLLARPSQGLLEEALEWVWLRLKSRPADQDELGPTLDRLLLGYAHDGASVRADHSWEQLALARLDRGSRAAVDSSLALLGRTGATPRGVWLVLQRAAQRDPRGTWQALREVLERRDTSTGRLLMAFRFQGQELSLPGEDVVAWVGDDESRARAVVCLVPPFRSRLPDVLRQLVRRFGPHSSVAREISARMHSTTRAVSSLARHDEGRLGLARRWLEDEEPAVQEMAREVVRSLEDSHAYNEALEEEERLRYAAN